jgi:rod shape-determining protein MreD
MRGALVSTSREEIEVHRFSPWVSVVIPILALFIQSYFPLRIRFIAVFDLPLLVTIFFAVARRRPVPGILTGAVIGTLQDALTGHPIGLFGISKTIVGYFASSIGVRLDVENPGSRFLMTFGFYFVHQFVYVLIDLALVGAREPWTWGHTFLAAFSNGLLAVVLFALLDRLKRRT